MLRYMKFVTLSVIVFVHRNTYLSTLAQRAQNNINNCRERKWSSIIGNEFNCFQNVPHSFPVFYTDILKEDRR